MEQGAILLLLVRLGAVICDQLASAESFRQDAYGHSGVYQKLRERLGLWYDVTCELAFGGETNMPSLYSS